MAPPSRVPQSQRTSQTYSTSTRLIILLSTILRTPSTRTTRLPQMSIQSFPSSTPTSWSVCRGRTTMEVVLTTMALENDPSHRKNAGRETRRTMHPYSSISSIRGGASTSNGLAHLPIMLGSNSACSVAISRRNLLPCPIAHSIRGLFLR